jgi:hypothetical protein
MGNTRTLATQLHAALEYVEDIRRLPVAFRVAKLIATMVKTGKGAAIVEVTQTTLPETLGVTRIPVARALERLENEGLLRHGAIPPPRAQHHEAPPAMGSESGGAFERPLAARSNRRIPPDSTRTKLDGG